MSDGCDAQPPTATATLHRDGTPVKLATTSIEQLASMLSRLDKLDADATRKKVTTAAPLLSPSARLHRAASEEARLSHAARAAYLAERARNPIKLD